MNYLIVVLLLMLSFPAHATEDAMYFDAAGRYMDVIRLVDSQIPNGQQATASQLAWKCIAYQETKQYSKALECADNLDARIARGDIYMTGHYVWDVKSDARPIPDMVRAQVFTDFAQYDKALAAGDRAFAIAGDGKVVDISTWSPERIQVAVLGVQVIAAAQGGELERAQKYLAALEKYRVPYMNGDLIKAQKGNYLARAYMAMGAYENALKELGDRTSYKFFAGIVDAFSPFGSNKDSLLTVSELPRLLMKGKALAKLGRDAEAIAALDQVLSHPRINDLGNLKWIALFERGAVEVKNGDLAKATDLYKKSVDEIELQRSHINTETSKIGFVGDKHEVYRQLIAALIALKRVDEAFEYVERSKSRALVDVLASKRDFAVQDRDPENVKVALSQLEIASQSARIQDRGPLSDPEVGGTRNLAIARSRLQTAAPQLAALVTVSAVPKDEIKEHLGSDEALVEYYGQNDDYYVFVLDRQGLQVVKLEPKNLERQVRELRAAVQQVGSDEWRAKARELYDIVWQPVAEQVAARKIILVPHGILHYLPFAALIARDGSYLADHNAVRFLPSASVLRFLRPSLPKGQAPLLAFGDPDLGDPGYDLRYAEEEAKAVAAIYPGSQVLLHKEASKSNFVKAEGAFSRIHFATHGKFNADQPLSSGLLLAGGVDVRSMLTVDELYTMNLNADLVTLSACETGLGKVANGDDVVGLTRGFLYAGARSIVASLWSVDDKATATLMESFYRNLATMNKNEALRQAQLSTRKVFPQPFYWAAFQLTGRSD